jgi:hypothetical protein
MSDQGSNSEQRRDKLLLRLLKTPPQPRPKRERSKAKPATKPRKVQQNGTVAKS